MSVSPDGAGTRVVQGGGVQIIGDGAKAQEVEGVAATVQLIGLCSLRPADSLTLRRRMARIVGVSKRMLSNSPLFFLTASVLSLSVARGLQRSKA